LGLVTSRPLFSIALPGLFNIRSHFNPIPDFAILFPYLRLQMRFVKENGDIQKPDTIKKFQSNRKSIVMEKQSNTMGCISPIYPDTKKQSL